MEYSGEYGERSENRPTSEKRENTMNSEPAGMHAAQRFISAFNAQDHEALAQTLNYPHVRLAGGRFVTVESPRDFAELSRKGEPRLAKEGWHHTEIESISAAQVGDDKVHLAMTRRSRNDRPQRCSDRAAW